MKQNAFLTCSWRFHRSDTSEQLGFKLEKQLEFRNLEEKLEKHISTNFQEKIRANQLTMEKKS